MRRVRYEQTALTSTHHGLHNLLEEIFSAAPCDSDQDIADLKRVTSFIVLMHLEQREELLHPQSNQAFSMKQFPMMTVRL